MVKMDIIHFIHIFIYDYLTNYLYKYVFFDKLYIIHKIFRHIFF
jgi:hypothetical protein